MQRPIYPFAAIVGQDDMKLGLIMAALIPELSGILIRGEKGTGKSTAVRGLAVLMPARAEVLGNALHLSPDEYVESAAMLGLPAEPGEVADVRTPVVELPVGATEDRLVGTLDLEKALTKGQRHFQPGLLAAAHRGILYVDEVNLLDDHLVDLLLDSAAMGVNTVEREGISVWHPARFALVGTMNPEEGELRPQLLDRFGLCVTVRGEDDPEAR
ncbi:MAG: ATP-binding protein, partial [Propionibacteriaceae bacterium]|nr:ATP-binding protein [Propionibacteriaceae bacterium]